MAQPEPVVIAPTPRTEALTLHGDRLLTPQEVCEILRMIDPQTGKPQTGTLANWRYLGKRPAYIRFGESKRGPVRYHLSSVCEWISNHIHRSTRVQTHSNPVADDGG